MGLKITFLYPDFFQYDEERYLPEGRIYLGIGYLSAYLKREGHRTSLIHLVRPVGREELLARLAEESPDLVAVSSTTHMFPHVRRWVSWIKEESDLFTVCGGAHPTLDPEGALREAPLDAVCLGEGEETLAELCAALEEGRDPSGIASLWVRRGEEIIRNPVRPLVEDLDSLPLPDREIFDPANFCEQQHERGTLMASRGCPYSCTYCSNHAQRSIYPNRRSYVRFRSVDNVMREIRAIIAADTGGRLRYIRFDDDILTLDREWFRELVERYREEVDLPFICNSRVDLLDEEKIAALKEAGCKTICMGIESGNPWLRKNVLGRRMSDQRILDAFRLCRKYGIGTVSLNMMGFPQEDFSMVLDTVKLNGRARPGITQITVFYPFPGTELYRDCREKGLFVDEDTDTLFTRRSALRLEGISEEQMELVSEYFTVLAWLYHGIFTLPDALSRPLERLTDQALSSGLIPHAWKKKACERLLSRLPWEWYMTTKY